MEGRSQIDEIVIFSPRRAASNRLYRDCPLTIGAKAERIGDESLSARISRSVHHNILCWETSNELVFPAAARADCHGSSGALTAMFQYGTRLHRVGCSIRTEPPNRRRRQPAPSRASDRPPFSFAAWIYVSANPLILLDLGRNPRPLSPRRFILPHNPCYRPRGNTGHEPDARGGRTALGWPHDGVRFGPRP